MNEPLLITKQLASSMLPPRKENGHKGDFGKLLIVGGSVGYTGAPYLAASAAVFSGCGLVSLGVPESIWPVEAAKCTSAMPFPLSDANGKLSFSALDAIEKKLDSCDVLALGPGLGQSEEIVRLVCALLQSVVQPVVLDADGLNALAQQPEVLDARKGRVTILTPHLAEFARLLAKPLDSLLGTDLAALACSFAVQHGCYLLLKGHRTIIALPDGTLYQNTTGCSALSKGGSGDVLTGLIASLLCQGASPAQASCCGTWIHGRAGDLLSEQKTAYCVSPANLAGEGFPPVFRELTER